MLFSVNVNKICCHRNCNKTLILHVVVYSVFVNRQPAICKFLNYLFLFNSNRNILLLISTYHILSNMQMLLNGLQHRW